MIMNNWNHTNKYMFYIPNNFRIKKYSKIAGFDLDHTIIKPKSGNVFPKNSDDWMIWDESVSTKLKDLINDKYSICIFSNQSKIKSENDEILFKTKINSIFNVLDIDVPIFISINKGFYRKPFTGLWDLMKNILNIPSISNESFYCGDAAGRWDKWKKGKKKDFSCSDRMFAHNIGIEFHTPEYIFLYESETYNWSFNKEIINSVDQKNKITSQELISLSNPDNKVIYISVGPPGSGKSTTANQFFNNFKIISQDEFKNKKTCIQKTLESINQGDNIIIDNTNSDKETRKLYIDIAKLNGYEINCLRFTTSIELSKYLNCLRCQLSMGKKDIVPDIAYNVFKKKLIEPSIDEGFNNIYNYHPDIKLSDKYKF